MSRTSCWLAMMVCQILDEVGSWNFLETTTWTFLVLLPIAA